MKRFAYAGVATFLVMGAGVFAVKRVRTPVHSDTKHTAAVKSDTAPTRPKKPADYVERPKVVRGLYLNAWAAGSPRKLEKLLTIADSTEINTFVIDVKEAGFVSYKTQVPLAKTIGADSAFIRDIKKVLSKVKAHGIYPIARIVCFKDPVLANAKPKYAIQKADGSLWHDDKGKAWVDSYNKEVWDYNIAIAREAIELGFEEVQWDYVRFPDVPPSYRKTQVYPAAAGRTKEEAIREYIKYSKEKLADLDVPITADVFGLTVSVFDDMNIGQKWERLVDVTDVLLPMVYPSHFARGSYGIAYPNAKPYETVRTAMLWALKRTTPVKNAATIRPWLQDFTLGPPHYGPEEVRAQKRAVYDVGLTEWILWNPSSNYNLPALVKNGAEDPDFNPERIAKLKSELTKKAKVDSIPPTQDTTHARG